MKKCWQGSKMIEQEVLGCFLKDNLLINETILMPRYFKEESHQLLFQSMLTLSSQNKSVDRVSLLSNNYDYIQELGGPEFITQLEFTGVVENFETYERQLIEDYQERESIRITKAWLSNKNQNNQDLITSLQELDELAYDDEMNKNELLEDMYDLPYLDAEDTGIPSGFKSLDNLTGGFQNHNSYIVGARPSMGKTALMLNFALSAMRNGKFPLIFSLEMSRESLLRRLISTIAKINLFKTRNPQELTNSQKETWQQAINELYHMDFEVYDNPVQTIQYMRSTIRREKRKHDKDIIVMIDYLTLIRTTGTHHSDHARISEISKDLKAMAKEYDCPVITLAQLSRGVEQRNDKRPMLSDLRESGSIEEDADGIMFLYRESYYDDEVENNSLEINLAKHRDGPTGTATVYYNKATGIMGDFNDY